MRQRVPDSERMRPLLPLMLRHPQRLVLPLAVDFESTIRTRLHSALDDMNEILPGSFSLADPGFLWRALKAPRFLDKCL